MMTQTFRAVFFALIALSLFSCKKDEEVIIVPEPLPTQVPDTTSLIFNFEAQANNKVLTSGSQWFTLANGDSFTVNKFNYYISNIKLKRADGTIFSEKESYHLNKHLDSQTSFTISKVPTGNYTQIEFLIGVDSVRNHSGAQTGDLDIANDMFWTWNSGYIFFKLEGSCKTSDPNSFGYSYHIGADNLIKKCTFNLSTNITAKKEKQALVTFKTIIDSIFSGIGFDDIHAASGGKQAALIAGNYKNMFSVTKVDN
ncbi:MAG: hypothetical protein KF900_01725 [Bacteroidetes bacterium]|nr:hypothetical protein [Bacteroidota bacterium]